MSENCIFCKIIAGQLPCEKVYEDEEVLAFLDINPISQGHTLVIPKAHYEFAHQCPPQVLASLAAKFGVIAEAICGACDTRAYNLLCNNGSAAGQVVGHLHFHIIPRAAGDSLLTGWNVRKYPEGQMERVAEAIREQLKIA